MDFFAHQTEVRKGSRRLVILFILAVVAIVVAIDVVLLLFFGYDDGSLANPSYAGAYAQGLTAENLWLISAAIVVLIGGASLYRVASLRGGGAQVARSMGATLIPPDTDNPAWMRLRNVIEEVALAAGVQVPDIFIMEEEMAINAFAAGYSPADAAVCVTQGCLTYLDRDELQGVIAHEFSHVLNGDMRLNIRLMGLLFGIMALGIIGRVMLYSGGRVRSRNGNSAPIALIGIAIVAIGFIGHFFARLIQAAVARSRESLADASAVQFTRQTAGLAGAFKKIAALEQGSILQAPNKDEVAHMLFGEASGFSSLFATHPPIDKRLEALGEHYDRDEIMRLAKTLAGKRNAYDGEAMRAAVQGFAPQTSALASAAATPSQSPSSSNPAVATRVERTVKHTWATPQSVGHAQVGTLAAQGFDLARSLHAQLPDRLRRAARSRHGAQLILLALALDHDAAARSMQIDLLAKQLDEATLASVQEAYSLTAKLDDIERLPLASLALSALRQLAREDLQHIRGLLDTLVHADHRVSLYEYCLTRLLFVQINDYISPHRVRAGSADKLIHHAQSFSTLCAIVASHGHNHQHDADAAKYAYMAAMNKTLPSIKPEYMVPDDWQQAMDEALAALDKLRVVDKSLVIDGLATLVSADGVISVTEAELLRVVCACLHCPMPLVNAKPEGESM